ncbi:MAG: aspartate--ammonia ligase [Clostridiales bacterium]|nr:aspartate--ammonia ligase [Clostridiales bacterium]
MKEKMTLLETLKAVSEVKRYFESELEKRLELQKVPSPLFVRTSSGLQDQLSGTEESLSFYKEDEKFEVVHSLAKWKRVALGRYDFPVHTGLYTDMKAIRKEEIVDEIHSLFVEQWDWEKVILREDRTLEYLMETVRAIYKAICETSLHIKEMYSHLTLTLPEEIFFITSQELEDMYPENTAKEREQIITKEKQAVFIIGVGGKLKSGIAHDLRSPDYDDWALNGDLMIYDEKLDKAIELSSMGIRVDEEALMRQLELSGCMDRMDLPYHQKVLKKEVPYTIGGGIGQSRLLMLLLEKEHIAEVQTSSWEDKTYEELKDVDIL